MTIWDWIFVFYVVVATALVVLLWYRYARPINLPKEKVCDGCGQVCTTLRDGLCVYCDHHFKPSSKPQT